MQNLSQTHSLRNHFLIEKSEENVEIEEKSVCATEGEVDKKVEETWNRIKSCGTLCQSLFIFYNNVWRGDHSSFSPSVLFKAIGNLFVHFLF